MILSSELHKNGLYHISREIAAVNGMILLIAYIALLGSISLLSLRGSIDNIFFRMMFLA